MTELISVMHIWSESLEATMPGLVRTHVRGARVWITFLNFGARIERWRRLDRKGEWIDLCLFYPDLRSALQDQVFMGVTIGRFANRIANGEFRLGTTPVCLECNESDINHIHGGSHGFSQSLWELKNLRSHGVVFRLFSPDGDQGYPGCVAMEVCYSMDSEDQLRIVHSACCSEQTVINTTNHAYFNLHGVASIDGKLPMRSIMDHTLQIDADQYLHDRGDWIPSGEIRDVAATPFDFREPHALSDQVSRLPGGRFNTTYVNRLHDASRMFAHVSAPGASWKLSVGSDAPGAIFYNGFALSKELTCGLYGSSEGLCIEPQNYPDCVNHPDWPSATVSPTQPYSRTIIYRLEEI
jgi:aldose 1-epimerase